MIAVLPSALLFAMALRTFCESRRAQCKCRYVVRALCGCEKWPCSARDLAEQPDSLEEKTEALAMQHDAFSRNTRTQRRGV